MGTLQTWTEVTQSHIYSVFSTPEPPTMFTKPSSTFHIINHGVTFNVNHKIVCGMLYPSHHPLRLTTQAGPHYLSEDRKAYWQH